MTLRFQPLVHDQRINVAFGWMTERFWQAPHGREAKLVPKPDRPFIAGRDEIELHGLVPKLPCDRLRVLAHRRLDSPSSGSR